MDGLAIENTRPFIVASSYAGAMTGLLISTIYNVYDQNLFKLLEGEVAEYRI